MRNYRIDGMNETQELILSKLQKILGFQLSDGGKTVVLQEEGSVIAVTKQNNEITISYSKPWELARAWYLMIRNDKTDCFKVTESNAFDDLGVMLDCSRNAVMKVETLKDYILQLALMGYRTLELYTEDTFFVEKEPYFGYMRGRYTKEEIKEIDAYCQVFGIELVPCIQTLAHINQITRYERYQKIVDVNDILFVGQERTYELIEHMVASVAECFSSRKINIGMDEAHMLGLGKYLDEHGYHDRFSIMINHLNRVLLILSKYGFKSQMWSDMFFRLLGKGSYTLSEEQMDQTLFDLVPEDVELIYWDYYSRDYNHYETNLKNHFRITNQVGFAGGAWKWTGFAPENSYSQFNGCLAMKACKHLGIKKFLVTCWGDNGAEASAFSVLPTLFFYAECAYSKKAFEDNFNIFSMNDEFALLTGLSFEDYMMLDAPNQVYDITDYAHGNACKFLLYNDPLIGTFDFAVTSDLQIRYQDLCKKLFEIANKNSPYAYLFQTLASLCHLLEQKCNLSVLLKKAYDSKDKQALKYLVEVTIPEVIGRLEKFESYFELQWHKENKSFGFEVHLIRFGGLKERLEYSKRRINAYLHGTLTSVEELNEERLPFAYFEQTDLAKLSYNLWNIIVSPGVIG